MSFSSVAAFRATRLIGADRSEELGEPIADAAE
jgi:hypothetical protein